MKINRKWTIAAISLVVVGIIMLGLALSWVRSSSAEHDALAKIAPEYNKQVEILEKKREEAGQLVSRCVEITKSHVACEPVKKATVAATEANIHLLRIEAVGDEEATLEKVKADQDRIGSLIKDLDEGIEKAKKSIEAKSSSFRKDALAEVDRNKSAVSSARELISQAQGVNPGLKELVANDANRIEGLIEKITARKSELNEVDDAVLVGDLQASYVQLQDSMRKLRNGIAALKINPGAPQALPPEDNAGN